MLSYNLSQSPRFSQLTRCWIGRDNLRDGEGQTQSSKAANEPTPNGGGSTACGNGITKGSHDGREEARNAQGEAEAAPCGELALEDLW